MFSTTQNEITPTLLFSESGPSFDNELVQFYEKVISEKRLSWTTHLRLKKQLGKGGQGIVFLTERRGSDGFTLPVALKIFSPERYESEGVYEESMQRVARVASKVAAIQHDNLIDVQNFVDRERIRMMEMEWVDGFDLRQLLTPRMLQIVKHRVSAKRWNYINNVIVTHGEIQPRFQPGIAIAIIRDCLEALAAIHREGIIHGDLKPANIMLKRTGHAKIIDIGSAYELDDPPLQRACTPAYAPIEVLEGQPATPRSDLASIGYVLLELLSGKPLFSNMKTYDQLVQAKRALPNRVEEILPKELVQSELLVSFCQRLVANNPADRFPNAEEAELVQGGAAAFHRQLAQGNLSSEYDHEIRLWLEEVCELRDEGIDPTIQLEQ